MKFVKVVGQSEVYCFLVLGFFIWCFCRDLFTYSLVLLDLEQILFLRKSYVKGKKKLLWYRERDRGTHHQGLGERGFDIAVMTLLTFVYKTIELNNLTVWVVIRLIGDLE